MHGDSKVQCSRLSSSFRRIGASPSPERSRARRLTHNPPISSLPPSSNRLDTRHRSSLQHNSPHDMRATEYMHLLNLAPSESHGQTATHLKLSNNNRSKGKSGVQWVMSLPVAVSSKLRKREIGTNPQMQNRPSVVRLPLLLLASYHGKSQHHLLRPLQPCPPRPRAR